MPNEDAYYDQDGYQATGYKIVHNYGNGNYDVETDADGHVIEYMLHYANNPEYDPEIHNEDDACDWYTLSGVSRL